MAEPGLLKRMDAVPYRALLREVMSRPPAVLPVSATLAEATRTMAQLSVSSVLAYADDAARPVGIVTEHDVTRLVAERGGDALTMPLSAVMTSPVHSVDASELVYVAIGRMARLGVRHLAVTDGGAGVVGVVTARGLMAVRAGHGLPLGDQVAAAETPEALAEVQRALPALAAGLLADGLSARDVAAVVSSVLRGMTARAAELAARDLAAEGMDPTAARWALLVLGSGGRGESMLAPDQDNAIVHDGATDDPWLAALGARVADILDASGIPYCKGGVMARNAAWRHSLDGWAGEIAGWIRRKAGDELLNVDIFYDFRSVAGDGTLAASLRDKAMRAAAAAPLFLRLLGAQVEDMRPPLGPLGGLFGTFRLNEGRIDLKKGGLMPIVCGVRALSLSHGIAETSSAERIAGLVERGALNRDDGDTLLEAQELLMRLILEQQIADIEAGRDPGNGVDPGLLRRSARRRLRDALRHVDDIHATVQGGLLADAEG